MKTKFLILTLALLNSFLSPAQYTLDWMNEAGEFNKSGVMLAIDDNNNVAVTGHWLHSDIYTRKYDSSGTLLWETSNGSGIQSNYQKPIWANCDFAGNTFVVGKRYTISNSNILEYTDAIVVLKYDPSGILLWKRTLPVTPSTVFISPRFNLRSETDQEGNLYIGTSQIAPDGLTLIKLAPDGTTIFQTSNDTNSGYGFGTMRLKNGKIYMTGAGDTLHGTPLVVWDTSGNLQWSAGLIHTFNTAPNVFNGYGYDLEVDDAGNTYLLSNTNHTNTVQTNNIDILVQKVNPSGALIWQQNYDFGGDDFPVRFALGGDRLSIISYFSGFNLFDWRTLQVDTNGNLLWNTVYDATTNDEIPYWVTSDASGAAIVIGKGGPSPSQTTSYVQMVVLKYSNSGAQQWIDTPNIYGGSGIFCKIANDNSLYALSQHNMTVYRYAASDLSDTNFETAAIHVNPNPVKDKIAVTMPALFQAASARFYDLSGKLLLAVPLNNLSNEIDLSDLRSGIYICRLSAKGHTEAIKLIKQ